MIPATYVPALCEITTSMIEKSESELTAAIEAKKKKMSKKKIIIHTADSLANYDYKCM